MFMHPLETTNRLGAANNKIRRQMGYSAAYPTGRELATESFSKSFVGLKKDIV